MCAEDAKTPDVLKGSGKEKFVIDCSCYNNCFLRSEETVWGDGCFRILQPVVLSQSPEPGGCTDFFRFHERVVAFISSESTLKHVTGAPPVCGTCLTPCMSTSVYHHITIPSLSEHCANILHPQRCLLNWTELVTLSLSFVPSTPFTECLQGLVAHQEPILKKWERKKDERTWSLPLNKSSDAETVT